MHGQEMNSAVALEEIAIKKGVEETVKKPAEGPGALGRPLKSPGRPSPQPAPASRGGRLPLSPFSLPSTDFHQAL